MRLRNQYVVAVEKSEFALDWSNIRPLNGGRDKGFEELCAQLARAESPPSSRFVRKGTPDAGVECYASLPDGSEWGWQSKYFDSLGDSQWSQIDDSVKTALEKHPRLARYFVCMSLDLPDGRIDGRKSAKDRWDEHVTKWKRWASDRGMTVEFTFWGSHEMLDRLSRPEHVGRVRFWFDKCAFDGTWLAAKLDAAIDTAGPRYTREIHVDLPIAAEFEAFGRTARFFDSVKAHAPDIRRALQSLEYSVRTDAQLVAAWKAVSSSVKAVLNGLSAIELQPIGLLPFKTIAGTIGIAEKLADEFAQLLGVRAKEHDAMRGGAGENDDTYEAYRNNPFAERRNKLHNLVSELRKTRHALTHADAMASGNLMLLCGAAGTGKTHLLCDVALNRVAAGHPTILLMGQQFLGTDPPWVQTLRLLDLAAHSAEEFVGALESAAQAAGSRALLFIDAINEGMGCNLWPNHMELFLAHVERSSWIGVVLSVRTSYEEIVLPEEVRARAVTLTHDGFAEHEYDAAKTFFVHYGLEFPSTPLLTPEFRNPLFLKTLCRGLQTKGEQRLPRGFHGITAIFDLYLTAINRRLALQLGFDPRSPLVRRALHGLATAFVDNDKRWLALEKVTDIVNALLPGREYERSLYRGLVSEGILLEEVGYDSNDRHSIVVLVAYERFADHLVAKTLLDRHWDSGNPAAAFTHNGPLGYFADGTHYVPPGLLEAMCIQVVERSGRELVELVPDLAQRWEIRDAFRQSLVWRATGAFSGETEIVLNKFCRNIRDEEDTLDVLLTVATLPDHPLNAIFLDKRLRANSMAERDAWWSIYLYNAWWSHGAAHRLIDWASAIMPNTVIDDAVVDLCSTSLTWMLTTSNRFLRDRATKALVNLLSGRLAAAARLIENFADVNDLYVAERVYAAAYGVAMRCHVSNEVGLLAARVYAHVFAGGAPPRHILLRDYARGVIERALFLGAELDVDVERIRPPYTSQWPKIPAVDEIKPLIPDWRSNARADADWAAIDIHRSVMDDDFGHYVIGTNSTTWSDDWLSARLEEPQWSAPKSLEQLLDELVSQFSGEELNAWRAYKAAENVLDRALDVIVKKWRDERADADRTVEALQLWFQENADHLPPELSAAQEQYEAAGNALLRALTKDHAAQFERISEMKEEPPRKQRDSRFDLTQIQRYIVWRVFDLGWTIDRFGNFDRTVRDQGRSANKPERVGKKYQWIAYHEIMAAIADNYQFRERGRVRDGASVYDGPWQIHMRDIDPSCMTRSTRGGTVWDGHKVSWWGAASYSNWEYASNVRQWVMRIDDLPVVDDLLCVASADGVKWLNGQGHFCWKQPVPADRDSTDADRGDLWYACVGYLIKRDDATAFLKWAESVDFAGEWMPGPPGLERQFLGEYQWSPASRYFQKSYFGDDGWIEPDQDCSVQVRTVAAEYFRETGGFDCSIDETYTLRVPISEIIVGLGIQWTGVGADFVDSAGRLIAQDPTVNAEGPSALLLREDALREFLARNGLTICWAITGERRVISYAHDRGKIYPGMRISGAYMLGEEKLVGFLNYMFNDRVGDEDEESGPCPKVFKTIRSE